MPDVVRAETFYLPPPPRRGRPTEDWSQVPGAELVFKWMEYRTGRRILPPTGTVDHTYYARVNQNRWLADCVCGSAQIISPVDPRYGCTECGYGWCALILPADVAGVEAALLLEPFPHLRNWWHPEDPANPFRVEEVAP